MQKKQFHFLRIFGIILLFFLWFFLGINRIELADFINYSLSYLPFISVLDMGIVSILFIILNAVIIWFCFSSISILKKTVVIHCLIYLLVVLLTILSKIFELYFLFNLSENCIRFFFSPFIPLFFILVFYISKKIEK